MRFGIKPAIVRWVRTLYGVVKGTYSAGHARARLVAKYEDGTEQIMPLLADESLAPAGFFTRARNRLPSWVAA